MNNNELDRQMKWHGSSEMYDEYLKSVSKVKASCQSYERYEQRKTRAHLRQNGTYI